MKKQIQFDVWDNALNRDNSKHYFDCEIESNGRGKRNGTVLSLTPKEAISHICLARYARMIFGLPKALQLEFDIQFVKGMTIKIYRRWEKGTGNEIGMFVCNEWREVYEAFKRPEIKKEERQ